MRILQITNGFPPTATAGVEHYTHQLSRGLSARHEVQVICRESAPERNDYDLLDEPCDGLQVRRVVNDFKQASQIQDYYLNRRIESIVRQTLDHWQPDLIHFQHCIGLSASLLEVAARAEIPHLLTLHDYWFLCSRVQLLNRQGQLCPGPIDNVDCHDCTRSSDAVFRSLKNTRLYRLLQSRLSDYTKQGVLSALSRATPSMPVKSREQMLQPYRERDRYMLSLLANTPLILTPSKFVKDLYARHGVPESRLQVVPLGLDLEPWRAARPTQPEPGKGLSVGYLGTLLEHKGVHVLLRAFRRLQAPGAILEIHGFALPTDPYRGYLRKLTKQDPRAKLKGRYQPKDLPDILSRIDVMVIPSLWHETFSIVAREALLSGTPVVASEIGALPEIIDSGQNGVLVPPGDVDALHAVLQRLSSDPSFLARLREGATQSAKKINSIRDHVHEIELLYSELVSNTRGSI